jgi:RHS repeat-associated protein
VYAGSMQVASSDAGVVEYYHVDHLGSTRLKTNSSGGVVYVSGYEPFGPGYGEDGVEDYRYTGKQEDPTGLYYYGARYYNPTIGRFTTRDKNKGDISDPHSLNQYIYCRDNPQKYTDPDGNIWNIVIGAGIGATVNVGSYWLQTKRNGEKFNWNTAATVAAEGAVKGGISAMCPGSAILAKSAFAAAASISSMYAGDIVRTFLHEDVKQRTLTDIAVTVAVDAGTTAGVSLAFGKVSSLKTLTANTVKVIENEVRPLSQQLTNYQFVPYSTPYEEKIADYTKSAAQLIVQTAYQIITSKGVSSSIYAMLDRDPDRNLTTNSNYSTSYGSVNCE